MSGKMSKLQEITQRVEASMCMTYGRVEGGAMEARISRDDWDAVMAMLTSPPASVLETVERILDESSAWISRPSREVTERIALAATIAAHVVLTAEVTVN